MPYHHRSHPRYQTPKLPAMVRVHGTFQWLPASVLNLSGGGLMLHCVSPLDSQSKIEIEVTTADKYGKKTLRKFKAKIVWKKNSLYGVAFGA